MSETAKDLVRRYLVDFVGNRDVGTLNQIVAEDAVVYGPIPGSRTMGRPESSLAGYLQDGSVTVIDLVAENDRVAARWIMTAPASAPGADKAERTLRALSVFWIEGQRIRKAWTGIRAGELWVN